MRMTQQYIITVDVGTSSTKTALWDTHGTQIAEASAAYPLRRPYPLWAEIDAELWWRAVGDTIREILATSAIDPRNIAGIGVDDVGWTLLPVDAHADPLFPALIWLDRRAEVETQQLNALPQANDLVRLVANPIDAAYITPKLRWLQQHHPDVFDATHKFLTCSGFIVARLTGAFTCDYTQAYGYHCFDITNARWDADAAALLGVPLDKLPPLHDCTEVISTVTARAAEDTGLIAGIPVIAVCLDAASGALGAGVTRPGQTNEQGGQAGGMAVSMTQVVVEPRLIFSHHVVPGQYILQAGTVGGGALGWFQHVLGQVETNAAAMLQTNPFEMLSQQAKQAPPGANNLIFLPYIAGEHTPLWNSTARGVFVGLSYNTTRADIIRAIMEGCAFAVYDNLRIAEEHGVTVNEYLGSGGATQSAVWCQIKADVYGKPFVVARRADGGKGGHSLGLYALTAYGVGLCNNVGACVERLLPNRQVYDPVPEHHAHYHALFQVYRSVSRKLLADFADLDAISRRHAPDDQAQ